MRPTDRARRRLRRAQLLLGAAAVTAALPIGLAAAGPPTPTPGVTVVQAQLLAPSPAPELAMAGRGGATPARWLDPSGQVHTGPLQADSGLADGARVPVGVDGSGRIVDPRPDVTDPAHTALLAALGMIACSWLALAVVGRAARARLDALDEQTWEAEWEDVEPLWSGRIG